MESKGMKTMKYEFKKNLIKILILLMALSLMIVFIKKTTQKPYMEYDKLNKKHIGDKMELIFLGIGKADAIIIRHRDRVILIDTGEVKHGPYIVNTLKNIGVEKINYLILTHPDKDHIGGAVDIIKAIEIENIIQSPLENGKSLQKILNTRIKEKNIKNIVLKESYKISMGEIDVKIFPPKKAAYKKDNDYSLLTLIKHNNLNFFFAGDAEKKRLKEALDYDLGKVDLYKVAHHGRYNSKSKEIIEVLEPKISIITNREADSKIIEALESVGSDILYSGENHIRILSDGEQLIKK